MPKINPIFYAIAIPLAGLAVLLAIFFFKARGSIGDAELFNLNSYRQDWKTLAGNQYLVRCQIDQQLGYEERKGRILAVKLLDGTGQTTGRVPIFVPAALNKNFETGQLFKMRVRVRQDGLLYAEEAEKK
ncbi:MAG: hypothetical protein LBV28_04265 [Puniceicoccales bacterium]|jgi:hypothetical protein|nr:hypothetical protein [Puniceicoccales bacterium]